MYSVLQIFCFLSMSWKILENILLYQRENTAFALIPYVSRQKSGTWNVQSIWVTVCIMGWTCTNSQGIKQSGGFSSTSSWCYTWYLRCYMMWSNCRISIVHHHPLLYTQIRSASTACWGKNTVWVENNMNSISIV